MNQSVTPLELKKLLIARGFEVYRTIGNRVLLAERVRDNLIMDAYVSAVAGNASLGARASFRAQLVDFHGETEAELFARARVSAREALGRGYREVEQTVVPIVDPSDRSHTLDVWYEISVELAVSTFEDLTSELRYLLGLKKLSA